LAGFFFDSLTASRLFLSASIRSTTLAGAYSARATAFAGVSTPLTWTEVREGVASGLAPQDFTIRSVRARLERVGDLWALLRTTRPADLTAALDGYV
jgi:bifunctional non-homologous end joining protein LigD